jgi:biotin synthase
MDLDPAELFRRADEARRSLCGDEVHVRGIIEFSNRCSRNCRYCGLRRGNAGLRRYAMTREEILRAAEAAAVGGVRTVVLQSGEVDGADPEFLARVVEALKRSVAVAVTLSVGVRPSSAYRAWRDAGADRYLLKFESASRPLYDAMHDPDSDHGERLEALAALRSLGYQVGTGSLVGLPGQSADDLVDDLALTVSLEPDMAAFGPFVPHPATPLASAPPGEVESAIRVIATARLALGPVHLAAASALDAARPGNRARALRAGANVVMVDMTPEPYRSLYQIYPSNKPDDPLRRMRAQLEELGRPWAAGPGHSLRSPAVAGRE